MKDFSFTGSWWLPDRPGRKLAGTLTLEQGTLELRLFDDLQEAEWPAASESGVVEIDSDLQMQTADVVHGVRHEDSRLVTLLGVSGATMNIPGALFVRNSFEVSVALVGSTHASQDAFSRVDVEFDYLKAWADPPTRVISDPKQRHVVQIRSDQIELASTQLEDGLALRLYSGVVGVSGDDRTELSEYCAVSLTVPEPRPSSDLINRAVRPLQDLLMVSLGRPVRLTAVRLSNGGGRSQASWEAHFPVEQRPHPVGEARPAHRLANDVLDYRSPTLLTATALARLEDPAISVGEVVSRWCRQRDGLIEVLARLLDPFYAPFMTPEHSYSATFQSAEALHDRFAEDGGMVAFDTKDRTKNQHRDRVVKVLDLLQASTEDVPDEDLAWADRVLRGRNDRSLSDKVKALVVSAGAAGDSILAASPTFAIDAARLRGSVAHGGGRAERRRRARAMHEQVLRWVVRGHLLCGLLPQEHQSQFWEGLATRNSFNALLRALEAESTPEA